MNNDHTLHQALFSRFSFDNVGLVLSYIDNEISSADIPVVMLHGFTASAQTNWVDTGWFERLTRCGRRVIALDARGHGESDKPHDSDYYPSHRMMEDSIVLLSQLGFAQADFVGYSMGARMSAFAAIKYPQRVRKLFLGGMGINLMKGFGNPQPIADALLAQNFRTIKNRNARRFRILAERGGNDLTALAYCIMSSRQQIGADELAAITSQTMIVTGDDDDIGGSAEALSPYIVGSEAREICSCNHFNALSLSAFVGVGMEFLAT